ncbi:MAG: hypothetical protein I3273_06240 [Candidatus Moeniiplasma glomeromycotorum]|nr:hypothetical protein [Candidatus Moeniiplasma glomeromycotorum]MCE8168016.1 hypothetical protein [Candidatus Moeniiplasma glomeromycotorum]MCE8169684.1 hypothetical protein [Candidatus Moeniiplasma glomeromycotorum]
MANPYLQTRKQEKELFALIKQKTLFNHYKNYEDFWTREKIQDKFLVFHQYKKGIERLGFKWFTSKVFERWCHNTFYGTWDQFRTRFANEIVTKFQELKRKEDLYQKVFPTIKLKVERLITLKNTDKTTGSSIKDRFQDKSSDKTGEKNAYKMGSEVVRSKEKPYRSIDMVGGEYGVQEKDAINDLKQKRGNWTSAEVEVQTGLRKRSKEDPDRWEWHPNLDRGSDEAHQRDKDRDKGSQRDLTSKISTREEQPQILTQMAKLIDQCMSLELPIAEYVDSFAHNFYINFMLEGEFKIGGKEGLSYKPSFTIKEEDIKELETEADKKAKKQKEQLEKLNLDQYQSLKEKGEAVEDSLTLENLVRRQNQVLRQGGKAKENREKGMKGLIIAWREDIIWSDLKNYDKTMAGITGFKEFKEELRKKTKVAHYYRSIGKRIPQTFYCLCGKAGVGKTEISKTLAKAYKRPIVMIGMAGQSHTKILKGMRPTLENATYGRVAEAFIEATNPVFRTKKEWQDKLDSLKKKPKLTNQQKDFKEYIEDEIKAIEEQEKDRDRLMAVLNTINKTKSKKDKICYLNLEERIKNLSGKWYALPSQAPIILLDEFEKVKDETVMFVVGQMTDREINFAYYDEFLEWDVDLSQAIIMLTANYWDRVPDFVRSRCKRINIQLLTFNERMEILRNRRDAFVREQFPGTSGKEMINGVEIKYDEDEYNKKHEPNTYTEEQELVRRLISEAFLTRCVTREFGVRGGIMNLVDTIIFLTEIKVEDLLEYLPTLDDGKGGGEGNFPYKIEEFSNKDDPNEGTLNLTYRITDKNGKTSDHLLVLTRKIDIEEIVAKEKKTAERYESVLNLIDDWPGGSKKWKPEVAPIETLDQETEEKVNRIQEDYLKIEVKNIRTYLINSDEKGYRLYLNQELERKEEIVKKLWLSKEVAEELEIKGEIVYEHPKKFYLLEEWIKDRETSKTPISLEKLLQKRFDRIISEKEYNKLQKD